ncbi:hypothetical protein GCM10007049_28120 [Echinicola pacifica]|uniref:N-acetylglucosaminyl deacetylase, LmbE family n=1 Tax=Echinicola pacifica TaxID=346377 RepID=A0A918Q422_9BACT|nr:PIG-L family deacetylase [Echinicola pacifica]GGZ32870.1 hypothetical protein GCM10007049_28120 [Echinicola pacifica]
MKKTLLLIGFIFFAASSLVLGAGPSSVLYHDLLSLKETKRILYIAAHPDDENTRLIAYLVNHEHASVGYLSLTRGDGGQNLLGKELGTELGMIRTQELLKARETDGGQQFFSRAIDFGYSKNPDETLNNWDKEKLLADVVWMIRKFQPDIIINRFNTTPGVTHGHHTTSAILSLEAFSQAADPQAFTDQLAYVKPWQAQRVFWNAYSWGAPYQAKEGKQNYAFETGTFDPLLGKTYNQIAADSRTMHKSQGFGSTASRGESWDYIEFVKGKAFKESPFEGAKDRWASLPNGKASLAAIEKAISEFDFKAPENNLENLLKVYDLLSINKADDKWLLEKQESIKQMIFDCLGLKMDFLSSVQNAIPGASVKANFLINNPSSKQLTISSIDYLSNKQTVNKSLKNNEVYSETVNVKFPEDYPVSQPYWVQSPPKDNLYQVNDQQQIGAAYNLPALSARVIMDIQGREIEGLVPLHYQYNDRVDGEVNQPFVLLPAIRVDVDHDQVYAVAGNKAELTVKVGFETDIIAGDLQLEGLSKEAYKVVEEYSDAAAKTKTYKIEINGGAPIGKTEVKVSYKTIARKEYSQSIRQIYYSHIPQLTYFPDASFSLIKLDLKISGETIGYIPGAGDALPEVLRNLGYPVVMLEDEDYRSSRLQQFKTLIVGIRAFNVNQQLVDQYAELMEYVKTGGNLIIQYNTTAGLLTDQMGPYPFEISRTRVSVENSPLKLTLPDHPILNSPNPIIEEDFEAWIQERGLYFAEDWDDHYQTPFSMNDPGEPETQGALLTTKYGEGVYTYSGISWFRLLPAGVPGAIKLFVNLIEQNNE